VANKRVYIGSTDSSVKLLMLITVNLLC